MKLENMERAHSAHRELKVLDHNLKALTEMMDKKKPVLIQENSDGSGLATNYNYLDGDYNTSVDQEILKAAFLIMCQAREELVMEIDEL